jgi:hypothetical protein
MSTCATTRLLLPAVLVGLLVSSVTGNDLAALLVAAATIGLLHLVTTRTRWGAGGGSCAVPPARRASSTEPDGHVDPVDAEPRS